MAPAGAGEALALDPCEHRHRPVLSGQRAPFLVAGKLRLHGPAPPPLRSSSAAAGALWRSSCTSLCASPSAVRLEKKTT